MTVSRPRPRSGVAALEFVLVFPMLCLLTVVGWWTAHAGYVKLGADIDARCQAWELRGQADGGQPFDIRQPALVSLVATALARDVAIKPPFQASRFTAHANDSMTDKIWDWQEFEFPEVANGIHSHTDQMTQFAQFIREIQPFVPRVAGFSAMDPWSNPQLNRYVPAGLANIPKRAAAIATMGSSIGALVAADAILLREAAQNAVTNPPLAAHYLAEAAVITQAIKAIPSLVKAARPDM